jgi:outer membrane protein assembly factor BamB
MRSTTIVTATILAFSFVTIASSSSEAPAATESSWPMFRGNPSLDGTSPSTLPDSLVLLWTFKTEKPVRSSAAIVDGKVYIGSNDGFIYCLDFETGDKIWSYETENAIEASPLVLGDKVYCGSVDSFMYCLDAATGKEIWKYETYDKILSSANWAPAANGGPPWIVFGSYDAFIHCVDSETGNPVWTYETANYVNGTPSIADGTVVAGGCDAQIHVVRVEDGTAAAIGDAGAYIAASVARADGKAYIGHYGNEFLSFDIKSGTIEWTYKDRAFAYFSSPAVGENQIVVGCRDKRVHCIDRETGEGIWQFRTRGQVDSSPVICGDRLVVGSEDGRLYIISLDKGEEIWSYEIGEGILSSPAVASGKVVIGSEDGSVYAFGTKD